MRNSKTKIRVTDAWFSACVEAAPSTATITPALDTNAGNVEKNLVYLVDESQQNTTNAGNVEKNPVYLVDPVYDTPPKPDKPDSLTSFVRKGGLKKGNIRNTGLSGLDGLGISDDSENHPYLTPAGHLVIPTSAPACFRWWQQGGMAVVEILAKLLAPPATMKRYMTEREFETWMLEDVA